jgi:dTDP-4-amino-4,6-dideoxygalactose transaminase
MVYRFVLLFPGQAARDAARERLEAGGVQAVVPVEDWELLHRYLGLDPEAFPNAERIAATSLSLPLYPALTAAQVDRICAALNRLEAA